MDMGINKSYQLERQLNCWFLSHVYFSTISLQNGQLPLLQPGRWAQFHEVHSRFNTSGSLIRIQISYNNTSFCEFPKDREENRKFIFTKLKYNLYQMSMPRQPAST